MTPDDARILDLMHRQVAAGELPGLDAVDVEAFAKRLEHLTALVQHEGDDQWPSAWLFV